MQIEKLWQKRQKLKKIDGLFLMKNYFWDRKQSITRDQKCRENYEAFKYVQLDVVILTPLWGSGLNDGYQF